MTKITIAAIILALLVLPALSLATIGGGNTSGGCTGSNCPPPGNGEGTPPGEGAGGGSAAFELPNPLECDGAECILNTIIKTLIVIGAPLAVLMILIGAFQIMTAGGSTEKVETGRKTITYAVIGFAILILSSSFIYIIKDLLGASD